jgi:hypothetical protein
MSISGVTVPISDVPATPVAVTPLGGELGVAVPTSPLAETPVRLPGEIVIDGLPAPPIPATPVSVTVALIPEV